MKHKKLIIVVVVLIAVAIAVFAVFQIREKNLITQIDSFDECAEKYPVLDSYPPRCLVPGGNSFTLDIGNELEYADELLISSPRPNQTITSPLTIEGQARGPWYFEGSFTAELFNEQGESLAAAVVEAQSINWMTTEFVPFKGVIEFSNTTGRGKLILKNANPSGLPENQKAFIIPVKF